MPMEKNRYPADWKKIAFAVKQAAGWRCQQCGKQCRKPGERLDAPEMAGHKYTLTVHHRDHQPDKELLDGVDCEGFLLVVHGSERSRSIIHNLSVLELAEMLAELMSNLKSGSEIQQALAIAEGLKKAREIAMAAKKDSMLRRILEK